MSLIGIPTVAEVEHGVEQAEDHLGLVLDGLVDRLSTKFQAILSGRKAVVSVTFTISFPEI